MIGRRGFITGLVSLVAAPAIVRAGSLMPVKQMIVGADFGRTPSFTEAHTLEWWENKIELDRRETAFFNAGGWYRPAGVSVDKWLQDMRVRDEELGENSPFTGI